MSKKELIELVLFIIISVINICIAYLITISLGIQNTVLFHTYTMTSGDITYEVLFFMLFSLIEATIYHYKYEVKERRSEL